MSELKTTVLGGMFDSTEIIEAAGGIACGNKAVDSEFFSKMISCFYRDGIFGGESFFVSPSGGMGVTVSAGVAWARGRMAWLKADYTFPLSAGDYTVLLRLDTESGEFSLVAKDGIMSAPSDTSTVRELIFATVSIPSSSSAVTADMISDRRGERGMCGFVTSTVDGLGTVELAQDSAMLGSRPAGEYITVDGGVMSGALRAKPEAGGISSVRNISYGTRLPDELDEGDVFILLTE